MDTQFTCNYCGTQWIGKYFSYVKYTCSKCGDRNVRVKRLENTSRNCFGYEEDKEDPIDLYRLDRTFLPQSDDYGQD